MNNDSTARVARNEFLVAENRQPIEELAMGRRFARD